MYIRKWETLLTPPCSWDGGGMTTRGGGGEALGAIRKVHPFENVSAGSLISAAAQGRRSASL